MATTINIPVYSDALVVLGTAAIVVPLVKRCGLSPVLGYLGAGALLGPLGLGSFIAEVPLLYWFTVVDARNVSGIADLGVVFLLFLIGLELSFERLWALRRFVLGLGSLQIAVSMTVIAAVLTIAGATPPVALVLGACLALSSTAIVLEVLSGQKRLKTTTGRTCFAVLLAQDLAVVPILIFVSVLGTKSTGSVTAAAAMTLIQAAFALALIVVVGRLLLRPILRLVAQSESRELFMAAVLFVIVATSVAAAVAELSMALGAFVAGLLLAETEYRKSIETTIEPFKGLLLGIFFFTVGMGLDVRELARDPLLLTASVVGLLVAKAAVVLALAKAFGIATSVAVESALLLAAGGEFAFVVVGLASTLGILSATTASLALAVTSLTMALIPVLALAGRRAAGYLEPAPVADPVTQITPAPQRQHAIVVGYGRVGQVVCDLLSEHGIAFTAVDNDPASVARDRREGRPVYFGDATDPGFLVACGLADASAVILTIHNAPAIDTIVRETRRLRPDVPILSRARDGEHAQRLYALGVTDGVPETIEASLQLSEASLVALGVPTGKVIASIHERRDQVRIALQEAARRAGRPGSRAVRPKS